jgi:hypothetical protein
VTQTPGSSSISEPNSSADDGAAGSGGVNTAATSPEKDPPANSGDGGAPAAVEAVLDPPEEPEEPKEPEEVPDILYCLDYRDFAGDLIQRKKDSKPIDVNSLSKAKNKEDIVVEKKPVLEIVTEITAQVNRPRRRAYPPARRRSPRSAYSSRSSSPASSPERAPRRPAYYSSDDEDAEPLEISKVGKTSMIIHSQNLNNAIRHVVKYYPGASLLVSILPVLNET